VFRTRKVFRTREAIRRTARGRLPTRRAAPAVARAA
jgi:hypothetical protein